MSVPKLYLSYINNSSQKDTGIDHIFYAFWSGFIFGPFSKGILYYVVFCVIFESIVYKMYQYYYIKYDIHRRAEILLYGFIGWSISRNIFNC